MEQLCYQQCLNFEELVLKKMVYFFSFVFLLASIFFGENLASILGAKIFGCIFQSYYIKKD